MVILGPGGTVISWPPPWDWPLRYEVAGPGVRKPRFQLWGSATFVLCYLGQVPDPFWASAFSTIKAVQGLGTLEMYCWVQIHC